MKKKILLFVAIISVLVCVFAISVSADSIVSSDSNEYGTLSTVDGVPEPTVLDKNAKTVIVVNSKYYTIPTYYLLADNSEFTWSVHANVKTALGLGSNVISNIVRIEIPEGIKTSFEISNGSKKFEGSSTLIEASLPTSLELMGEYFFDECKQLTTVKGLENTKITKIYRNSFYSAKSLQCAITLPSTVTMIDSYAFSGSAITSIAIPDSVTTIGDHAFASCTALATVTISENSRLTTANGSYHFEKTGLTSFYFPSGLTSLGTEGMFYSCSSLTTIQNFENIQITNIPYRSFEGCPITSLTIPSGVESIGKNAFKGHNIQQDTLVIPNGVTTLYECAFAGKKQTINKIILPASLTSFGGTYCFEYFYAKEWYIPAGLSAFGECTFNGLTSNGVVFYFTGNQAQAEALKSATNTNKNGAFTGATVVDLDTYNNATDKASKNYIVYGYSACEAFYKGVHKEADTVNGSACYLKDCERCDVGELYIGGDMSSKTHSFSYAYDYASGLASAGALTTTCANAGCNYCAEKTPDVAELNPIFKNLMYSKREGTEFGIVMTYEIDNDALAVYKSGASTTVNFGVVAIAEHKYNSEKDLVKADGTTEQTNIILADISDKGAKTVELVIKGTGDQWDAHKATPFYILGYYIDGNTVNYFQSASKTAVTDLTTIKFESTPAEEVA